MAKTATERSQVHRERKRIRELVTQLGLSDETADELCAAAEQGSLSIVEANPVIQIGRDE